MLPAARLGRRTGARWDRQGSGPRPGTIIARRDEPDDVATVERHRRQPSSSPSSTTSTSSCATPGRRITTAVAASQTTLTEIFGIGPIVAGMLIGYAGDPTGHTASRFAAYTGTRSGRVLPRWADHSPGCRGAAAGGSTMRCTSPRSPRSATRTGPVAAHTNASSPKEDPTRSDPLAQAAAQRRRLAAPRRRLPTRRHPMISGPGRTSQDDSDACVAGSNLNAGASAKSLPGPRTQPRSTRRATPTGHGSASLSRACETAA